MDVAEDTARKQSDLRSLWVSVLWEGNWELRLRVAAQHLQGKGPLQSSGGHPAGELRRPVRLSAGAAAEVGVEKREAERFQGRARKTAGRCDDLLTGALCFLPADSYVAARIGLITFSSFLTVQTLVREGQVIRETKDNQIAELKKLCEQSAESLNNDWEKKVSYKR